jgi:hypothetical protein
MKLGDMTAFHILKKLFRAVYPTLAVVFGLLVFTPMT